LTCSSIGGASLCLYAILKNIDRSLIDPYVVLFSDGPLVSKLHELDIPITILKNLTIFPIYEHTGSFTGLLSLMAISLKYPKAFHSFYTYCSNLHPDIVYLNSSAMLSLAWPAKKAGVPLVYLHNREHWNPKGIMRIKNMLKNILVERYIDKLFHITQAGISQFGDFNISSIIRDWPSLQSTDKNSIRKELKIDPKTFIALVPGGMQKIKGSKDVLESLNYLEKSTDIAIIVLGCYPVKLMWWKYLAKIILRRGLYAEQMTRMARRDKRIFLLPSTLQIKKYIEASNVIICPFRTPHAAKASLEAQYLSKPVIIYEGPEAQEYVVKNKSGYIIPVGDITCLSEHILLLKKNQVLANTMGTFGHDFVYKHFSKAANITLLNTAFYEYNCT